MFIQILLAIFIGVTAGIFTGLAPGIHINLVSALILTWSPALLAYFSPISLGVIIISMGVTHTFLDTIPSVFLGAPDESQVLGALPGHRYLLKGQGMYAVKMTLFGSYFALLLSIIMFPFLIWLISFSYEYITPIIPYLLIFSGIYQIWTDRKKLWALLVFTMTGILGLLTFSIPNLQNSLFPLLSGLFGISTLIYSLSTDSNIPPQTDDKPIDVEPKKSFIILFAGNICAFLTSTLPGLSSSIAAIMASNIIKKMGDNGFLILVGGIGTSSFILSLATLFAIGKARNGAIIVVQELIPEFKLAELLIFMIAGLIAASLAAIICLKIGRALSLFITKIPYKGTCIGIISLLLVMSVLLSGWIGFLIILTSTAVGLIPAIVKVKRSQCMGCLLLPVIIYLMI